MATGDTHVIDFGRTAISLFKANSMKPSSTKTLIAALRILAAEIQSGDGVANAAIAEAADRLEKYSVTMQQVKRHCQDVTCREYPEGHHYAQAIERIRDEIDW